MEISANTQALAYLVSAILFILALKGLTHPATARRGNFYGMGGMVIAIAATLMGSEVRDYGFIIAGVALGAVIGTVLAMRIQMTAMPQLVAALHSFVGLAAVLVAIGTFLNHRAEGHIDGLLMGELSAGVVIGAITFTGSVIAFGKLQGLISGSPIAYKGQNVFNISLFALAFASVIYLVITADPEEEGVSVAEKMEEHRLDGIPVVRDGVVIGIVTRTSLARVMQMRTRFGA